MLIKCPECGKEISDKAENCPNCGYPISKEQTQPIVEEVSEQKIETVPKKDGMSGLGIAALIFSALGFTFWLGIILAIIDFCKKNGKKKTCSVIAVIISLLWILLFKSISSLDDAIKDAGITTNESTEIEHEESRVVESEEIESETTESEIVESEIETETVSSGESRDDFVNECVDFSYKTFARNPDEHIGEKIKLTVDIFEVCSGGIFSEYDVYYKTFDDDLNMIWVFDRRNEEDKTKLLEGDTITAYGVFTGMVETKNHLTGSKGEDVGIELKYVDIRAE